MVTALGLPKDTSHLTPAELMKAILLAPVDLLWNGGIGTYVKASTETNAEIGDRANDAIRVNGNALRVKVVGEGGNLGLHPAGPDRGRPRRVFASTPMRSTTARASTPPTTRSTSRSRSPGWSRSGELTLKRRNVLLASMTDEVAAAGAARQLRAERPARQRPRAAALDASRPRAADPVPGGARRARPSAGVPARATPRSRNAATSKLGLTSPEFSVLVAYAKLYLKADLTPTASRRRPLVRSRR